MEQNIKWLCMYGISNRIEVKDREINHIPDLECMTEEAGCRLILHIAKAGE